ncbi:MAG: enediyne polyketide synthase [Acidobacteriota bacterium]|jgi:enediyne polyketide synthase|nr:enediyne polyketide synthase [Acidobacteriota bacterium]
MSVGEGIAIVGMACRYPDARTPGELWENVLARRRAFRRLPPERLRLEDYAESRPGDPDSLYLREAAVLEGWEFDRVRFRVAGPTFRSADLAHWLALDVAAQALADAGFPDAEGLPRDSTGVLLGNTLTGEFSRAQLMRLRWPYVRRTLAAALAGEGWEEARTADFLARLEPAYKAPFEEPMEESLAGGLANTIAGRICNHFDLHGGGYILDGACASSLLATANACSALTAGDLDVALAGGVDLSLDPFELVGFARTGALTHDEMRIFDVRSAGFLPGEGCGFVVLMREGDAARLGCRVRAVIRGWGISSDGHGGISRPEAEGQKMALRRAYRRAGFGIETVALFEGHGTGTAVGDAAEVTALSQARRESIPGASTAPPAALGSIKANIGHTKAAAGIAGLIKAALAVDHQILPPTTGCDEPHAEIAGPGAVLRVLQRGEPWPAGLPLRAAVSAMGFGGINSHLVLEGTAESRRNVLGGLGSRERELVASWQDAELLLLAGPDAAALAEQAERLAVVAGRAARAELADLAAELRRRLNGGAVRAAVVAAKPAEAEDGLRRLAGWLHDGETSRLDPRHGVFLGSGPRGRIGFLFPGQGAPSHLDGGALRRRFEELEAVYGPAGLDPQADPVDTAVAQPAILSHSLAGLRLLDRLGLRAAVAVGHSLGEIAALHWGGAFDAPAALRLARGRGRAMADLPGETGAMAGIGAEPAVVKEILTGSDGSIGAVIAVYNAPRRTVISGPAAAVDAAVERAQARGLAVNRLRVSHAFHSPLVAGAAGTLAAELAALPLRPLARTVASTVTGGLLSPEDDLRALLISQVTSPVRFTDALAAAGQVDLWIEVGPGRALSELTAEILDRPVPVIPIDVGGPSLAGLLQAAGAAFALGSPLDTEVLFAGRFTRPFDPDRVPRFLANPCESAPLTPGPALPAFRPPVQGEGERTERPQPEMEMDPASTARDVLRLLVAQRAELPADAVRDDSRLLSDLHLNSISVGQLVVEAARRLGLRPPASPTDYARATLAEVALALEAQSAAGDGTAGEAAPPGVDSWVRPFTIELVPRELPHHEEAVAPGRWTVLAPAGHPLAAALTGRLPGDGVALCLPPEVDERQAGLILQATRAVLTAPKPARFLLVHHGGIGGGFARTLKLEMLSATVCVVQVPADLPVAADWIAAEMAAAEGYAEACYDEAGVRRVPVLRLLAEEDKPDEPGPLPLGPDDVLLVTGGGKGIAAECALDLARATGVRLALLGRSLPASDAELAANLERMAAAGVRALYLPADVTDAAAVNSAVASAEAELGPVTALLHGAGTNHPRKLADLDETALRHTFAPKTAGLSNLLAAVDPGRLRLLVTFGSIIARLGLPGEADYAVANEWLARATERFAREHPACRCLALEWSVWSGVGMGERLGTVESLRAQGISPIPAETGLALLRDLISRPLPTVSVVVTGRFGAPPTLEVERPELPLLRYLERPRVHIPGVELVVDSEISADTDPHLADHVFRGEPLFAAVLGMEAMAQAATAARALLGKTSPDEIPMFEDVVFQRPVAVPPGRSTTIRVAALVRTPQTVEVVLRDASTGFAADHFRAVCRFGAAPDLTPRLLLPFRAGDVTRVPLDPASDLYGGVLFHRGRFRRVEGYRRLRATECLADISPDGSTAWFGSYLPDRLLLGDPGARDAAIHGIQACIPHATLLPTGVDRVVTAGLAAHVPLVLAARERSRHGDDFVYDLELVDAEGRLRERWEGLRLRAVDRIAPPASWTAALLAPYVERRLQDLLPGSGVRVTVEEESESHGAVFRLLGDGALRQLRHRPDGRPEVDGGQVSVSHAGRLVLAVTRDGRVGCDLEAVSARPEEVWRGLLGPDRFRLAELIARERGETPDAAATRVWTAMESLAKAGAPNGAPLTLEIADRVGTAEADGWLVLRSGTLRIGTLLAPLRELSGPAVLAVLAETGPESPA